MDEEESGSDHIIRGRRARAIIGREQRGGTLHGAPGAVGLEAHASTQGDICMQDLVLMYMRKGGVIRVRLCNVCQATVVINGFLS